MLVYLEFASSLYSSAQSLPGWPDCLTLKKAGDGGSYVPAAQEIACHFSQDHARVLRLLDFFKNDVRPRVKESF